MSTFGGAPLAGAKPKRCRDRKLLDAEAVDRDERRHVEPPPAQRRRGVDFVAEVADPRTLPLTDAFWTVILPSTFARDTMPSAAAGDAWYSPNPTTSSDNPNFPPSQLQWAARSAAYASVRPPVATS